VCLPSVKFFLNISFVSDGKVDSGEEISRLLIPKIEHVCMHNEFEGRINLDPVQLGCPLCVPVTARDISYRPIYWPKNSVLSTNKPMFKHLSLTTSTVFHGPSPKRMVRPRKERIQEMGKDDETQPITLNHRYGISVKKWQARTVSSAAMADINTAWPPMYLQQKASMKIPRMVP